MVLPASLKVCQIPGLPHPIHSLPKCLELTIPLLPLDFCVRNHLIGTTRQAKDTYDELLAPCCWLQLTPAPGPGDEPWTCDKRKDHSPRSQSAPGSQVSGVFCGGQGGSSAVVMEETVAILSDRNTLNPRPQSSKVGS